MEGYGVDAYLYLPVLGVTRENLPNKVLLSPGNIDSIYDKKYFITDKVYDTNFGSNEQFQSSGRYFSIICLTQSTRNAL